MTVSLTRPNTSSIYARAWDHLPVDTKGNTVGKTPDILLRRLFHEIGIPESHTAGMDVLCGRYAARLCEIGSAASDRAVMEFLERHTSRSSAGAHAVFEISTRFEGEMRRVKPNEVRVPGINVLAKDLPGPDLFREMTRLGIPNLSPSLGWQDLAFRLGVYLQRQEEAAAAKAKRVE
jgi:hypothetical protein